MKNTSNYSFILSIIIIAQFFCTSLWFAGNGVINELILVNNLTGSAVSWLSSAVQVGFIAGTLFYAVLGIVDKFPPSKVFFVSALLGGLMNFLMVFEDVGLGYLIIARGLTGFFLAGIYPVGMKIASDYFKEGLGSSLSYLVAALVFGTAFPHLLSAVSSGYSWKLVIYLTSILATLGGCLMLVLVPVGPFRKKGSNFSLKSISYVFKDEKFNRAAVGYFGHMWELYAFWVFLPVLVSEWLNQSKALESSLKLDSLFSFLCIAIGVVFCVLGAFLIKSHGENKIARIALAVSGLCCLISPFMHAYLSSPIYILYLFLWSGFVIMDSPLFSSMVAKNAPAEIRGTALTLITCIGFFVSAFSIQLTGWLKELLGVQWFLLPLVIGPIIGLGIKKRQNRIAAQ